MNGAYSSTMDHTDDIPIIVSAGYDPNDETMRACRENWRHYVQGHPDIMFVCNRVDSTLSIGSYLEYNGDLHIGMKEVLGEGAVERPYAEWGSADWSAGHIRGQLASNYFLNRFNHPYWFIHTNITGFVCFKRLKAFLATLKCSEVYAGAPIYFQPENFIYLAGSHIIWSSDYFRKMVSEMPASSFEASDITWGRPFRKLQKLMVPIANFLSNESPNDSSIHRKLELARRYVDSGHFLFRFKNIYPGVPREYLDPYLHSFTMMACETTEIHAEKMFSLIREFGTKMLRGEGMAAVTMRPRSSLQSP